MKFFTENSIQIKTIEKDSGVIYAEHIYSNSQGMAFNKWADCGYSYWETPISSNLSLNVFVRNDLQTEKTVVSVNVIFTQKRFNNYWENYKTVPCNSTGILEHTIMDHIYKYMETYERSK